MAHHFGGGKFRTNKYKTKFVAVNSHGRTLFIKLEFAQKFVIFGQNCARGAVLTLNYTRITISMASGTCRSLFRVASCLLFSRVLTCLYPSWTCQGFTWWRSNNYMRIDRRVHARDDSVRVALSPVIKHFRLALKVELLVDEPPHAPHVVFCFPFHFLAQGLAAVDLVI